MSGTFPCVPIFYCRATYLLCPGSVPCVLCTSSFHPTSCVYITLNSVFLECIQNGFNESTQKFWQLDCVKLHASPSPSSSCIRSL